MFEPLSLKPITGVDYPPGETAISAKQPQLIIEVETQLLDCMK
jgi:hypothetical protein